MVRLRFATLAVAAGLGLASGCISSSQFPLLQRLRGRSASECCEGAMAPDSAGPILEGPALSGPVPGGPGIAPMAPMMPQSAMPQLAPPPRIVPQPQAQPTPYTP